MARYEFKLPDIGEGIAEAEIVAWHVKVGDQVKEDQQLADMMTDKATVEMESPVAGRVVEVAGEVGDQIPIGSVLVVFETEAAATGAEASAPQSEGTETNAAGERTDSVALGDGMVTPTQAQEQTIPSAVLQKQPPASSEVENAPRSRGPRCQLRPKRARVLRARRRCTFWHRPPCVSVRVISASIWRA
jgi:2-oxoisovalerate dehydrogenase E2 component (dihydrolipoyl transacylase)